MTSHSEDHLNLKVAGADRADYDELENDKLPDDDEAMAEGTDSDQGEIAPRPAAAGMPIAMPVAGAHRVGYHDELDNEELPEDDEVMAEDDEVMAGSTDSGQGEIAPPSPAASLPTAMPTTAPAGVHAAHSAGAEPALAGVGADSTQVSAERLSAEWREIQASFVDDPRGAVQMAADAAEAVLTSLVASLRDRQATLGPTASQDTEQLRAALQEYRKFCQGVAEAGRRLATG